MHPHMTTTWLQFVRQGAEVERFHATKTLQVETVGTHSHGVAMLCYALSVGAPSVDLLMAALCHDLAEQVYGDIPAPTKRALGISEACAELEDECLAQRGLLFTLTPEEERILKLADILDGMLFCVREAQLGSRLVAGVYARYAGYFNTVAFPEDREAFSIFNELETHWMEAEK